MKLNGILMRIYNIESNNPFDVVFLYFLDPVEIPDRDVSCNIITFLDCMIVSGIRASSRLKEITSEQVTRWAFVNFFVPFWIPKIIVVDVDGIFSFMFKKSFQKT